MIYPYVNFKLCRSLDHYGSREDRLVTGYTFDSNLHHEEHILTILSYSKK